MKNRFIVFSLILLVIDQLIKYFFYTHPGRAGVFGYYLNQNLAGSLPIPNRAVIVLTIILLMFLRFQRARLVGPAAAWWLLGAGAVANLIDRLMRGGVVDYIWLPFGSVINLADILIAAGVIWILCSRR